MRSSVMISDWLDEYLQHIKHRTSKSAFARYQTMAEQYWIPEIGQIGIFDIKLEDLHLVYARHEREWRSQKLQAVHRALHIALAAAQRSGGMSYQAVPVYSAEISTFLCGCDRLWLPFWSTVLEARVSTVYARRLTWPLIDWSSACIVDGVKHTVLPVSTLTELRAHHVRQASDRIKLGSAYKDSGLVFCRETGDPLTDSAVLWNFKRETTKLFGSPRRLLNWTRLRYNMDVYGATNSAVDYDASIAMM